MQRKLQFIWSILVFNVIKPLPCSDIYFRDRFYPLSQDYPDNGSHYRCIVTAGKKLYGRQGIFLANLSLISLCLPLSFLADFFICRTNSLPVKMAVNLFAVLILIGKFDMLLFRNRRNYLKLLYLLSCVISPSYWTISIVFLVAFENIGS